MIGCEAYAGQVIGVLGLGRNGLACARALRAGGARVLAWDDNADARTNAEAHGVTLTDLSHQDMTRLDALVISPGIPHTYPAPHPIAHAARDTGVPIIGDVELLARSDAKGRMVGITGTNGKSTTTALVGHILDENGRKAEVGGNLGPAICDMEPLELNESYILELSSYQLDLCPSARLRIAVLLNVTPDHLDRHGGMDGYLRAKKHIFRGQGPGDVAVVGLDDEICQAVYNELVAANGRRIIGISGSHPVPGGIYARDGALIDDLENDQFSVMKLDAAVALPGVHNAQNICAAYAVTRALNLPSEDIARAIQTFPGLPHRQEIVADVDGIAFVNDSKATNAEAAVTALACYDDIYWIAGGQPKAGGIESLTDYFPRLRHAYLIGQAATDFAETLDGHVPVTRSGTLAAAVADAYAQAKADGKPGAVVLLSPASASFDQFENFEARGDAFRDLATALAAPGNQALGGAS